MKSDSSIIILLFQTVILDVPAFHWLMQYRTLLHLSDVNSTYFMEQVICQGSCHAANLILLVTGSVHRVFIYYNNKNSHCGNNFSIIIEITIMLWKLKLCCTICKTK